MRRSSRPPINMAWPWCSPAYATSGTRRSEEHTSELQSRSDLVCRLLLEKKKKKIFDHLIWQEDIIVTEWRVGAIVIHGMRRRHNGARRRNYPVWNEQPRFFELHIIPMR